MKIGLGSSTFHLKYPPGHVIVGAIPYLGWCVYRGDLQRDGAHGCEQVQIVHCTLISRSRLDHRYLFPTAELIGRGVLNTIPQQ